MKPENLIEFVTLCDKETGHYFGHYDPANHVIVLQYRGKARVFPLPRLESTTRHMTKSMVVSTVVG